MSSSDLVCCRECGDPTPLADIEQRGPCVGWCVTCSAAEALLPRTDEEPAGVCMNCGSAMPLDVDRPWCRTCLDEESDEQ